MLTLNSPQVVQETILRWKRDGKRIAFVPTMGCLHEGHQSLVRQAKEIADKTVVSIFVNPTQFGPNEDFSQYPRTFDEDEDKLEALNTDLLFAPGERELYPPHFSTTVSVKHLTDSLCGAHRPGHFEGVALICAKLFNITQADFAIFGEKDFQQVRVIEQMASDLNLPVTILRAPTIRESDSLAMSSRNRYLSPEGRAKALALPNALIQAQSSPSSRLAGEITRTVQQILEERKLEVEYLQIASEKDLRPVLDNLALEQIDRPRLFAAVKVDNTRLIDNVSLAGES